MADGATIILALTKPEVGASDNTWGDKINTDLDVLDAVLADLTTITTATGTVALSTAQQKVAAIFATAALSGNLTLRFSRKGRWFVYNGTSGAFSLTVDVSGQATPPTIAQGSGAVIYCDGTKVYVASTSTSAADWVSIASATTTDIGSLASTLALITGTTTITGLGTVSAGTQRWVRFNGILTLTYNATSLILPGSANIVTAAGDSMFAVSAGSGNWRVLAYFRASGLPPLMATAAEIRTGTSAKPIGMDQVVAAQAEVTITYAASVAPNFSTFIDAVITLTGDLILANASAVVVGRKGRLRFVQGSGGNKKISYGTDYEFAGGSGSAIVLSTPAGAEDVFDYDTLASGRILLLPAKAIA